MRKKFKRRDNPTLASLTARLKKEKRSGNLKFIGINEINTQIKIMDNSSILNKTIIILLKFFISPKKIKVIRTKTKKNF